MKRDFELGLHKVTSHSHPQTNIKSCTQNVLWVLLQWSKTYLLLNKHKDLIVGGHVFSHHNFSSACWKSKHSLPSYFHFLKHPPFVHIIRNLTPEWKCPLFSVHSSICPLFLFHSSICLEMMTACRDGIVTTRRPYSVVEWSSHSIEVHSAKYVTYSTSRSPSDNKGKNWKVQ